MKDFLQHRGNELLTTLWDATAIQRLAAMNQIGDVTLARKVDRPSADPQGRAIRGALDAAWHSVRLGERSAARAGAAQIIARHQVRLDADSALVAETVAVLAAAHGFLAITRLVRAITGRSVVINLVTAPKGGLVQQNQSRGDADQFRVSPACLANPSSALAWSQRLLRRCARS